MFRAHVAKVIPLHTQKVVSETSLLVSTQEDLPQASNLLLYILKRFALRPAPTSNQQHTDSLQVLTANEEKKNHWGRGKLEINKIFCPHFFFSPSTPYSRACLSHVGYRFDPTEFFCCKDFGAGSVLEFPEQQQRLPKEPAKRRQTGSGAEGLGTSGQ